MSVTLNNIETTENYPNQAVVGSEVLPLIISGKCAIAEVDVYNHAVYSQLLVSPTGERGSATWTKELFLPPGHRTFIRKWLYGVRFRSAVAAEAGRVTVELIGEDETYLSYLIAGGGAYN